MKYKHVLKLANVTKKYGNRVILENVNLEILEGKIHILLGPSGHGKSTLLRIMCLLEECQEGEIEIFNHKIDLTNDTYIKKVRKNIYPKVSILYQQLHLWPHLKSRDNIILPIVDKWDRQKKSEYKRLVKHFSLLGILKQYPNQLSLGQKQRIAIVRNLLIDSKIYLWDEVSSALDKDNTLKVIEEIDYQIRKSKTFVIVTHDIFFLKELFNRFYYNKIY